MQNMIVWIWMVGSIDTVHVIDLWKDQKLHWFGAVQDNSTKLTPLYTNVCYFVPIGKLLTPFEYRYMIVNRFK